MNHDLQQFALLMLRAVLPALFVVALTAFLTMPYTLGHHPGERAVVDAVGEMPAH